MTPDTSPAAVEALKYATELAKILHEKHYAKDAPEWQPLPDLIGVLTQIDNMTSGLVRATPEAAPVQGRVKALVWLEAKFCGQPASYAHTEFGDWMTVAYSGQGGRWAHTDPSGEDSAEDWPTRQECEAAAQADYETRILSALEPAFTMPDMRKHLEGCVNLLEALVVESGNEIPWDGEDAFRMGEWFEDADIAVIHNARQALSSLKPAEAQGWQPPHIDKGLDWHS